MPNRLSRAELLLRFFPEIRENKGADTDGAKAINTRACETILADLISLYDAGLAQNGQGILALRLFKGAQHSGYLTRADLQHDLDASEAFGDQDAISFFKDAIEAVDNHNTDQAALIALADNSRCQVIPIGREHPAAAIQALLQEVSQ